MKDIILWISFEKPFLIGLLLSLSQADRLDNTYLPPSNAFNAGGNGNLLSAPHYSSFQRTASPEARHITVHYPETSYGAPSLQERSNSFGSGRNSGTQVPILRASIDNDGFGGYKYEYETGNGIQAYETGQLKTTGSHETNEVHGSYSYTGPDGQQYTVTYTADENGFHPQGAHLPTPPPIPEAILKSLQYNAQHSESDNTFNSGHYQHEFDDDSSGITVEATRRYLAPAKTGISANNGYHY